ncbi:MAG: sodium:calcium antiporter [Vampirovibrionales bacterium]
MWIDIALILALLVGIVWVCSVFTNAIEWLGHRLSLSQGAVGSVLAAVGTALPETIVPIVAIVGGLVSGNVAASHEIGIGAILGAPFMLGTLAFFISGATVVLAWLFKRRSLVMPVDEGQFNRDALTFLLAYGLAIGAAFLPNCPYQQELKYGIALALVAIYALYAYRTLSTDAPPAPSEDEGDVNANGHLDPLLLAPKNPNPSNTLIYVQTGLGLLGIVVLAHFFVHEIEHLSHVLGLPALLLSLVIIPIATELPEKFNSVTWLLAKKDTLAIGNLTGAMVFQSCIPAAVGVAFTPWHLEGLAPVNVVLTAASALVCMGLAYLVPKTWTPWVLMLGGGFYAYFIYRVVGLL